MDYKEENNINLVNQDCRNIVPRAISWIYVPRIGFIDYDMKNSAHSKFELIIYVSREDLDDVKEKLKDGSKIEELIKCCRKCQEVKLEHRIGQFEIKYSLIPSQIVIDSSPERITQSLEKYIELNEDEIIDDIIERKFH